MGAHQSVGDGLHAACRAGKAEGCEVIQIFTHSSRSWGEKPLDDEQIRLWEAAVRETGVQPLMVHDSYLINIASPKKRILGLSLKTLEDEIRRADRLGIPYLVMHPGAHLGQGEDRALDLIVEGVLKVLDKTAPSRVRILLENTAGQGTTVGYRFEHLRRILDGVNRTDRMGVCLDTCHLFTSGYDISTKDGYHRTFGGFGETVGFEWLKAFHLNDSRKPLGSRVDRHEHIGLGHLGTPPFQWLLEDDRFRELAGVLETPVRENRRTFKEDLEVLRGLPTRSAFNP